MDIAAYMYGYCGNIHNIYIYIYMDTSTQTLCPILAGGRGRLARARSGRGGLWIIYNII